MPKRENKATLQDSTMQDAFKQGFEEGMQQIVGSILLYELMATFEGTDLRRVQFSDLDQALNEARHLLLNGSGMTVTITVIATPSEGPAKQQAVAASQVEQTPPEDIEDADVVEETPSDTTPR